MTQTVSSYAALGDSFTAGNGAPPGEPWADQLAAMLRTRNPALVYSNLAIDGATSTEVLEQVPAALTLRPELVTVICGANDVLRTPRPDLDRYERHLDEILSRLTAAEPRRRILTATAPESWLFIELRPRTRTRLSRSFAELNEATRRVAAAHDVLCLEVADHPGLADPTNFGPDGLHPSKLGHAHAAGEIARALRAHFGIECDLNGGVADGIPALP